VPVALYNARNTDDAKDIEYRVKDHITEQSKGIQFKQSELDETYNRRTGVERTNGSVNDCGFGRTHTRGRNHAPCRRNYQLQTWRQSGKYRNHDVKIFL